MDKGVEIAAITAGGGILALAGKWVFGKRQAKIDLLQTTVDTMLKIIEGWKEYAESLQLRIKDLEKRVHEQDEIIYKLRNGK